MVYEKVFHNIDPVFDSSCKILMLGSMPSLKSRQAVFFYAHPQNRFWSVLSAVLNCPPPMTVEQKKDMLLLHHIALWDVIGSCEISGSSDSSVRNAVPNDFSLIFDVADIKQVFTLGKTATELYKKFTGVNPIYLPSTSPANNAVSTEKLIQAFSVILDYIK